MRAYILGQEVNNIPSEVTMATITYEKWLTAHVKGVYTYAMWDTTTQHNRHVQHVHMQVH